MGQNISPIGNDWNAPATAMGGVCVPPSFDIAAVPDVGQAPIEVQFTLSRIAGSGPFIYFWDFGDGSRSIEQNPLHIYADGGDYTVSAKITNACGTQELVTLVSLDDPDPFLMLAWSLTEFESLKALVVDYLDMTDRSAPDYDDSSWPMQNGPWGSTGEVNTPTAKSMAVWARKSVLIPIDGEIVVDTFVDDEIFIYIDGVQVLSAGLGTTMGQTAPITAGHRVLAVWARDAFGPTPSDEFYAAFRIRYTPP